MSKRVLVSGISVKDKNNDNSGWLNLYTLKNVSRFSGTIVRFDIEKFGEVFNLPGMYDIVMKDESEEEDEKKHWVVESAKFVKAFAEIA